MKSAEALLFVCVFKHRALEAVFWQAAKETPKTKKQKNFSYIGESVHQLFVPEDLQHAGTNRTAGSYKSKEKSVGREEERL